MLAIRITGANLKTARQRLGWSLQEAAARSRVNWLTIKRYEGAGEYLPGGSVGALNRLVDAFEHAGIRFDADGAHLDRAAPAIKPSVLNDGAAA
jgi:transcriptional regulator with XRE-family HTH domain